MDTPHIDIDRLDEQTWCFNEGDVRFFLLCGNKQALLIDTGMHTPNVHTLAQSLTALPIQLLNTHADRDHTGGNADFTAPYMHPAEWGNHYHSGGDMDLTPIWDGDRLDLGDRPLEILHTPGHTPGSIAVLDISRRWVFSGDPIQDGQIFMFGIFRDMYAYRASLLRLRDHSGFDAIYPSHGSYPLQPSMIDQLYEASGRILAGTVPGQDAEIFGNPICIYDVGIARFLCDRK